MRRFLSLLSIFLFATSAFAARRRAVTPSAPLAVPGIETIAAAVLEEGIPGMTIAVRKGNAMFVKAWGLHDREANIPARTDSQYEIASLSKQFTAAATMRLVEQGKLGIDDHARTYLPELDDRFDSITIRHLLNHTSGIRPYEELVSDFFKPITQQEVVALITSGPPQFAPGTQHEYSNGGYFLLGMIIERLSSQSYPEFVRDAFFVPLDLDETSYCDPGPDGYVRASPRTFVRTSPIHMSTIYAAGALCSTATDLVRWNAALVSGRAVSAQSYEQMTTDGVPAYGGIYGFGLIADAFDGRKRVWHNGSLPGFQSYLSWFPEENLTVAVIVNASYSLISRSYAIGQEVERAMKP